MQDMQFSNSGEEFTALQCLVCGVKMWNPLILPCLHTFCENCMIQWLEEYLEQFGDLPKKMRCPTCSKLVRIPENGLEGLRYDSQVSQVRGLFERLTMKERYEGYSVHERQTSRAVQHEQINAAVDTVDGEVEVAKLSGAHIGSCDRCTAPLLFNKHSNNGTVLSSSSSPLQNSNHISMGHDKSYLKQGMMDFDGEVWSSSGVTG